jgi:hypothetical protein
MRQFTITAITFFVMVLLIFGLYAFSNWFSRTTGYVLGEDEKLKLAQCLEGKNAVFYISFTCPYCEKQIKIFGETAMNFIDVKLCNNLEDCPEGGVPAWEIQGKIHYGFKDFNELSDISGCSIDLE